MSDHEQTARLNFVPDPDGVTISFHVDGAKFASRFETELLDAIRLMAQRELRGAIGIRDIERDVKKAFREALPGVVKDMVPRLIGTEDEIRKLIRAEMKKLIVKRIAGAMEDEDEDGCDT